MTQPLALRLADTLEHEAEDHMEMANQADCRPEMTVNWCHATTNKDAAIELRRLHAETEAQRAVMRDALETMKFSRVFVTTREKIKHPEGTSMFDDAITALREALGEKT